MKIRGSTALVTGSNRGIGRAFIAGLSAAGAGRIYAGSRDLEKVGCVVEQDPERIVPVELDITNPNQVQAVADRCGEVDLLINNGGVLRDVGVISAPDLEDGRFQMEVNFWGTLRMCRAFAPVLKANGGGAIVNILSNLALVHIPYQGFYCASKAAAWSMTHGVRAQLAGQGTLVVAVLPDAVDTEMVGELDCPKVSPESVVEASLAAVEEGKEDLFGPEVGDPLKWSVRFRTEPKAVEKEGASVSDSLETDAAYSVPGDD